jgi:hypothetical protein
VTTVAEQVPSAASSLAGAESLTRTATVASSWLLVEVRGAWGRDAVVDSGLAPEIQEAVGAFPGKVLLVRRPDWRGGPTIIRARSEESGAPQPVRRSALSSTSQRPTSRRVTRSQGRSPSSALTGAATHAALGPGGRYSMR